MKRHDMPLRLAAGTVLLILGATVGDTAFAGKKVYGGWTPAEPQLRTDGSQVPGGCPIESPAGKFLFTARNPGSGLDIFVNQRDIVGGAYEVGAALPAPANDPEFADDFCPTPLPDNELYFVSRRDGGCGSADMMRTVQNPATGWAEPQNLGCHPHGPNTPGTEFSPSVITTFWGATYLFYSTDFFTGNQDIYRSEMRADGTFGPGVRLPYPINTEFDDRQPNVSPDGRELVFTSNRPSSADDESGFDIFYARRQSLFKNWRKAKNLSETVPFDTLAGSETRPSLSWDGRRLVYGSGGVWVSDR
ncbi:MAG: hypothetical protein AAGF46_06150 [Pseudomonadota bacterium]